MADVEELIEKEKNKSTFQKIMDLKEVIIIIFSLISFAVSSWAYVTTKFALKEYVDYNLCMSDRNTKYIDAKWGEYLSTEALNNLHDQQILLQNSFRKKTSSESFTALQTLNDSIVEHKSQIKEFSEERKKQQSRDCLKEAQDAKK